MGEWRVGHGFDFLHFKDPKIGAPLFEPVQRIVIRPEPFRNRPPSSRLLEHLAQRHSIDDSGMHAKPHDPARVLVHHDQHPVRSQGCRLAPEQINAPQAVFRMAQKHQPGRAAGSRQRSEMKRQNPTDHVSVDLDTEGQSDLLRDSWTSPTGITPFHLDDYIDKFSSGPFGTGPTPSTWRKKVAVFPILQGLVEVQKSGGFQDDGGTDQTSRAYQERAESGDEPIGYS